MADFNDLDSFNDLSGLNNQNNPNNPNNPNNQNNPGKPNTESFSGILQKQHKQDSRALLGIQRSEPPELVIVNKPSKVQAKTLNELDLDSELLDQYKNAKTILEDILSAEDIAPNQKAQVINTITSILQAIIKTQQDLHNVERIKLIEATLIETLQKHETLKESFLADYELALSLLESRT